MRTDKAAQLEELRKLEKMCENGHGYASKIKRKRRRKRGRGRKNGGCGGKEKEEGRCGGGQSLSQPLADSSLYTREPERGVPAARIGKRCGGLRAARPTDRNGRPTEGRCGHRPLRSERGSELFPALTEGGKELWNHWSVEMRLRARATPQSA